jgi:hypothetical protein
MMAKSSDPEIVKAREELHGMFHLALFPFANFYGMGHLHLSCASADQCSCQGRISGLISSWTYNNDSSIEMHRIKLATFRRAA